MSYQGEKEYDKKDIFSIHIFIDTLKTEVGIHKKRKTLFQPKKLSKNEKKVKKNKL